MNLQRISFWRNKAIFNHSWTIPCALVIVIALVSSIMVYIRVSHEFTKVMEERLFWEAKFYREQLDQVFLRAALRLDDLVRSPAAVAANREHLQDELEIMRNNLPSSLRSWVAYPDGTLIPAPNTRPDAVYQLPWWRDYLKGTIPSSFIGYPLGRSQAIVGKPLPSYLSGMSALIPLISMDLRSTRIMRAAGLELDLNQALADNTGVDVDWSGEPVSVYGSDGRLLASPYQYYKKNMKSIFPAKPSPLIRQMLKEADSPAGFKIYRQNGQPIAGAYLRDPSLGLIIVVEHPAAEVIEPVRRIAAGPLVITVLCLIIATLFARTLYAGALQLREAEQLTRSAEFRALQAHINPHFLFNTLDRMVGFAVASGSTQLIEMLRALANIFRYTTRRPSAIVALEDELKYLNEYLYIQRIRYNSQFTFALNVPDDLLATPVLKFCIQPLVENCFVHSVEKSFDPIAISVTISRVDNDIEIRVCDDGPGITEQRLAEVNATLEKIDYDSGTQEHSVGIPNIHHRVRYTYGPKYGITLLPSQPAGLTVLLRIPMHAPGES